jgi:hypothetical protein
VTRSTKPANTSWLDGSGCGFMSMITSSFLMLARPGVKRYCLRVGVVAMDQHPSAISHYQERATRAEEWLRRIEREIEDKLISPQAASRTGVPSMS